MAALEADNIFSVQLVVNRLNLAIKDCKISQDIPAKQLSKFKEALSLSQNLSFAMRQVLRRVTSKRSFEESS